MQISNRSFGACFRSPTVQCLSQDQTIGGVVIDHQNTAAAEVLGLDASVSVTLWRHVKLRIKSKRAPLTRRAAGGEASIHAFNQSSTDPETGASILSSGGSIRLGEIVEDRFQMLGWNSDSGVGNGKLDLTGFAGFVVPDS